MLTTGQLATLAIILEARAPKPGNVHPGASFCDAHYGNFVAGAVAIGTVMNRAADQSVGATILQSIQATRRAAGTNTNLGTVLLLSPLATIDRETTLQNGLPIVLSSLTPQDSQYVYEAIRIASPGGLGASDEHDVAAAPPEKLLTAMQLAAERDLVARQFVNGYDEVFQTANAISGYRKSWAIDRAVVLTQLAMLAERPDSLIVRKCGAAIGRESAARAQYILESEPWGTAFQSRLADFDNWLRGDGHRRNPGTTADLVAAGLFVWLRER